jgi:hypothetical protein
MRPAVLALIFTAALILRTVGLGGVFHSNDSVETAYYSGCNTGSMSDWMNTLKPARTHSILGVASAFILVRSLGLLGLPVTEFVWNLPYAFTGTLTVISAYMLVKLLFKKDLPALTAALLMALLPVHVYVSRSSGHVHHSLPLFLETTTLIAFYHYYEKPSSRRLLTASILLSASMLSHVFFPLIFITLVYMGAHYTEGQPAGRLTKSVLELLRAYSREPVLTVLLVIVLAVSSVFTLYHSGASYGSLPGIHFRHYMLNMLFFMGVIPLAVGVFCLNRAVRYVKDFGLKGVPAVLFLSHSLPFLFIFDRCITNHFTLPAASLTIMVGAVLGQAASERQSKTKTTAIVILISSCFLIHALNTLGLAHTPDYAGILAPEKIVCKSGLAFDCIISPCTWTYPGGVYPDSGVKAAGYWIREHARESDVVFSDASGGAGIETNVLGYYARRRHVCLNDASLMQVAALFNKTKDNLDVLLIRPENELLFGALMEGGFRKTAVVYSEGNPVLLIYTRREFYEQPAVLDLLEYNRLYDAEYSDVRYITDCLPGWRV